MSEYTICTPHNKECCGPCYRELLSQLAAERKRREEAEADLKIVYDNLEPGIESHSSMKQLIESYCGILRNSSKALEQSESGAAQMREALQSLWHPHVHAVVDPPCLICKALSSPVGKALLEELEAARRVCNLSDHIPHPPKCLYDALVEWRAAKAKTHRRKQ